MNGGHDPLRPVSRNNVTYNVYPWHTYDFDACSCLIEVLEEQLQSFACRLLPGQVTPTYTGFSDSKTRVAAYFSKVTSRAVVRSLEIPTPWANTPAARKGPPWTNRLASVLCGTPTAVSPQQLAHWFLLLTSWSCLRGGFSKPCLWCSEPLHFFPTDLNFLPLNFLACFFFC